MSKLHIRFALHGFALGFCLFFIGFADYAEVHKMFLFADLRLFLTFISGVVFTGIGLAIVGRNYSLRIKKIHPGTLPGGIVFGFGWALTGACPGIAFVQIGAGFVPGLVTLAGMTTGIVVYRHLHKKVFKWDKGGGCEV